MKKPRRILVALAIVFMVAVYAFGFVLPDVVGARMNAVRSTPPYTASPKAQSLHETLWVADLHADSLLAEGSNVYRTLEHLMNERRNGDLLFDPH